jgi:dTDP-4-amino-4,6-dideoxygalactose transaminase
VAAARTQVPVFDLEIEPEDVEAVAEALRSGWLTMGPRTEAFERAFADYLGCRHVVAVSSGTAALHLACLAAGIGEGDEVIVPSQTFVATANAVLYCGGTPVLAEVSGPRDLGIDPDHVESLITPRTKAVLIVHYAGYPASVTRIAELCRERGLALIEDAAHAPSASVDGRALGTFGAAGCFSFFSNKALSCGEGGALATDSDEVAERVRGLRSQSLRLEAGPHGLPAYEVAEPGFNYRIDEPRAALLRSRLPRLDAETRRRRELVLRYRELLSGVDGLTLPWTEEDVPESSCYLMIVEVESRPRDPLVLRLRDEHGIQTSIFPPIHRLSAYRRRFPGLSLPKTDQVADTMFSIPLYPHMTHQQQDRVAEVLADELRR